MFQSFTMLSSTSSGDRTGGVTQDTWSDFPKQKEELQHMRYLMMKQTIQDLKENCETLRTKERKSQDRVKQLESEKSNNSINKKQELHQCRQTTKRLVSCL